MAMAERVLLVDDDTRLTAMLSEYLAAAGFLVESRPTGQGGLAALERGGWDAVVLDLMLPDLEGFEVCRRIRGQSDIPILMLTARGEEVDRVVGFELGADDYVVKPFSPRELVLRVQAILRREGQETGECRIVYDPLVIDLEAHTVRLKGKEVGLTSTEFKLLQRLARRPGRAFSRDQLLSEVWGYGGDLETRTVDTHVKRLRAKLGEIGAWIETVRGLGYRFRPAGFEFPE